MSRFGDLLDDWLDYLTYIRRVTPQSQRSLRGWIRRIKRYIGLQELAGSPIDSEFIERFLASLARAGAADSTQRTGYAVLHAFCRWACDRRLLGDNPMRDLRPPLVRQRPRRFATKDEIRRILTAAEASGRMHARRDAAILACYFYAGMRASEALRAVPEDLDFEARAIWISGKGGRRDLVPLHHELAARLKAWLRLRAVEYAGAPYLFPARSRFHAVSRQPIEPQRIQKILRQAYAPAAGAEGVTPHSMRRGFATRLRRRGAGIERVQRLLRHRNIETTRLYLGEDPEELRADVERL